MKSVFNASGIIRFPSQEQAPEFFACDIKYFLNTIKYKLRAVFLELPIKIHVKFV